MKKLERDANNASSELNQREALEAKSKQLAQEEQFRLIKCLIQEVAKEQGLAYQTILSKLSKEKLSTSEQLRKDEISLERVRKEAKYLSDLVEKSNLVSEEDKSTAENCAFHNQFDSTTRSFLTSCRKNLKRICTQYRIEYDLKQFKEANDGGTI